MKRFGLLVVALAPLAGCGVGGAGGGRPSCSTTDPCEPGYYCARTADGNVCWADTVRPVIQLASFSCSDSPCRRDSVLHVTATVSDDVAMGTVTAVLDLEPDHPRPLERASGADYAVDIPLAEVPFPYFEHAAGVTVKATDEAANLAEADCGTQAVTRARWTASLRGAGSTAFPLFSPALLPDGRVVVAGSDGSVHFVSKSGSETRSAVSIGSVVNSPPAVGVDAIWLATPDGKLHELRFDGSVVTLPANCSTTQQMVGPPAVNTQHAFVGSKSAVMLSANGSGYCNRLALSTEVSSPPVVTSTSHAIVATGSVLRSYSLSAEEDLLEDWTGAVPAPSAPSLSGTVSQPMAMDVTAGTWTTAQSGAVDRTTSTASTSAIVSVSAGSAGAIVLVDNSAVLSDAAKRLVRVNVAGSLPWTTSDSFTGAPAIGLLLNGSTPTILVPTDQGRLYAVGAGDGRIQWSTELSGQSLAPANIWTEPGATTSTAYLAGADGNLYAIIVDGALDTSAPWPKAFHDPQNTSNAGVTP